jgi:hypothetical protein
MSRRQASRLGKPKYQLGVNLVHCGFCFATSGLFRFSVSGETEKIKKMRSFPRDESLSELKRSQD